MTKDQFVAILTKANGAPVVIVMDNMTAYHINIDGHYVLTESDFVYLVQINKNNGGFGAGMSQMASPWEFQAVPYDQIYYAKIYPSRDNIETFLSSMSAIVPGETLADIKKAILSSDVMKATSPKGVGAEYSTKDFYGQQTTGVTVDTTENPYYKRVQDEFNAKKSS